MVSFGVQTAMVTFTSLSLRILVIVLPTCFQLCSSNHFRGGTVTWRTDSNTANSVTGIWLLLVPFAVRISIYFYMQVLFSFTTSWRRSLFKCDDNAIAEGQLTSIAGPWYCVIGCDEIRYIASTAVRCTTFSDHDDWSQGGNTFKYTFSSPGPFLVRYRHRLDGTAAHDKAV